MPFKWIIIAIILVANTGCAIFDKAANGDSDDIAQMSIQNKNFQYKTTQDIKLEIISSLSNSDISFQVFKSYEVDENYLVQVGNSDLLGEFITNNSGEVNITLTLPSYLNEIYIKTDYPGTVNELFKVDIIKGLARLDYSSLSEENAIEVELTNESILKSSISKNIIDNFSYLIPSESGTTGNSGDELWSTWDSSAVPNTIIKSESRFPVSDTLLQKISDLFPEKSKNVADTVDSTEIATNLRVVEDNTEVWITFIHEGAGYRNTLAYYTYDKNSPPTSIDDIGDVTLVFPNASYKYGGGGLISGDTVYLGSFSKDTVIGWVLFSNAYSPYGRDRVGEKGVVRKGYYQLFSNKEFNPNEVQQMALVNHEENGESKLVLAYEDILRPGGDQDFNDTVFYVSAEPEVVADTGEFLSTNNLVGSEITDTDLSGSSKFYFPSKDETATLAFEDLWPVKGDYDFNDLVVDYNFEETLNSEGNIVEILASFKVASYIGAGFTRGNGFAFQIGVDPETIAEIEFYKNSELSQTYEPLKLNDYVGSFGSGLAANNTEIGTEKAVIIVSDCIKAGEDENAEFFIKIKFSSAQKKSDVGAPPYNPFVMSNGLRGREVHLSDRYGTIFSSSADDLLIAGVVLSDDTIGSNSRYTTVDNLPWVLNIPVSFAYPEEGIDIRYCYNYFVQWASSDGEEYKDWYLDLNGYRNNSFLHYEILSSRY